MTLSKSILIALGCSLGLILETSASAGVPGELSEQITTSTHVVEGTVLHSSVHPRLGSPACDRVFVAAGGFNIQFVTIRVTQPLLGVIAGDTLVCARALIPGRRAMTLPPGTLVLAYGRYSCVADGALTGDLARYDNNLAAFVLEELQRPSTSGGMGRVGTRVFTQDQVQATFAAPELQLRAQQTTSLDVLLRVRVMQVGKAGDRPYRIHCAILATLVGTAPAPQEMDIEFDGPKYCHATAIGDTLVVPLTLSEGRGPGHVSLCVEDLEERGGFTPLFGNTAATIDQQLYLRVGGGYVLTRGGKE